MPMNLFKLEDYLSTHEFTAPHLLCCSDAQTYQMAEIVSMAAPSEQELWHNLSLGYTEVQGLPQLRQQIIKTFYPSLAPDNILCFSGAEEGIFCALHTLCDASDHVIILTPCYQSLMEIPTMKGCEITSVALQEQNKWRIDIDDIKKAIKSNTKCIVINFPHNPTGQVITQDELEALIALCAAHDLWLFSDEVYRLLGTPLTPWAKPAAEIYPKALSLGVTSKALGLAGLRIGWIACQDQEILKQFAQMKHYTSICNSAPAEVLSLIALKNSETILNRNNQIVASNLTLLDTFFKEYNDLFSWVRPQGGCVGFVNYKSSESTDTFCARLIQESGVLLMPASMYDYPGNHFRIGFGRENMPEALARLKVFLESKVS